MERLKDNFFTKNSAKLAGLFGTIFTIWAVLVATHSSIITSFDTFFINLLTNTNPANITFATNFTTLGNTKTLTFLTILVGVILLLLKKYGYAGWFVGTMALANLTNTIIKNIVQRPRPNVKHLVYAGGYSFPSGHSIGSMTFFLLLVILVALFVKNKTAKLGLTFVLIAEPLLVGYTRIFVHVHYPSDVFGGFLLAWTFICLSLFVGQKLAKRWNLA